MGKVVLACFLVFVAAVCMIGVAAAEGMSWCIANPSADDRALQGNIDFACDKSKTGIDCAIIKDGGICFKPNNVAAHASVAMNMYYQKNQRNSSTCDFNTTSNFRTGIVTYKDPSQVGGCQYTTTP